MKNILLAFAHSIAARLGFAPALPVIQLHIREMNLRTSGWSRLHVYVTDGQFSRTIEHLTGTRTLRPRHLLALSAMGYTFAIDRTEAQTVPVWLCKYIGAEKYLENTACVLA